MIYQRSKPYAATFFKATGGPGTKLDAIPRYKFMYYANLVPSAAALAKYSDYKDLGNWQSSQGISFKIHTIDKPRVELTTAELNQYNRKRYVYTKTEYQPLTIRMYDTSDDRPLELWTRYFTYYFGDSRPINPDTPGKSPATYKKSVVGREFDVPNSTGWGLNPEYEDYAFFDRIELYAIFGKRYSQVNYINPKITSIDWQNFASDSSEPAEMNMTLKYEALEYVGNKPIDSATMSKFGFDFEAATPVRGAAEPVDNLDYWNPNMDFYGIINSVNQLQRVPIGPLDGILKTFQVANSTLNLFTQLPLGAVSQRAGEVLGQTSQFVSATTTVNTLLKGQIPSAPATFLGRNVSALGNLPNQVGSVLNTFGSFKFGK